jgi:very-short-patch-repair endonuclease
MSALTPDSRIAELSSRQLGLLTRAQAQAAGLTDREVYGRVRSGALVIAGRGVYRLAGAPRTWEQRALAAVLAVGGGAVLFGRSAATVWRLDLPSSDEIEVAASRRTRRSDRGSGIAVHWIRTFGPLDRTAVGILPTTSLPRTLVDLAATLTPQALTRVVDDALSRRLATPQRICNAVSDSIARSPAGIRVLREVLEPWSCFGDLDSVAEAACARVLMASELPVPVSQHRVRAGGATMRLDFAWPAAQVALEIDSFRWHANAAAHANDLERDNLLLAAGWTVVRTRAVDVFERPAGVVALVRKALSLRAA